MGIEINLTCTAATVRSHMQPLWSGRGMETSGEAAETGDGPVLGRVDWSRRGLYPSGKSWDVC